MDWMLIEGVGVDAHAFVVRINKERREAMGLMCAPDTRCTVLGGIFMLCSQEYKKGVQNYIDRGNGRRR